jgi:hypothetical protein
MGRGAKWNQPGRLVIGRSRATLAVEVAYSLPKLEAARVLLQRECPRCSEGLRVGIGMKVSQRENPRFSNLRLSTEEVALISEHSAISFQLRRGREVICPYGCSKVPVQRVLSLGLAQHLDSESVLGVNARTCLLNGIIVHRLHGG